MAVVSWSMRCGAACPHVFRCDDKRQVTLSGPVMSRQSVVAQGFAFGTGSAVAHNVVGSMVLVAVEEAVAVAAAAAATSGRCR
jgi:hypothetical protein